MLTRAQVKHWLFPAIEKGDINEVKRLLSGIANIRNLVATNGETPLHEAAYHGRMEIIEYLIEEKEADVNVKADSGGYTPLHLAAQEGREEVVRILRKKGANVNQADKSGRIPLHTAVKSWRGYEAVDPLINLGADINAQDEKGKTPLHIAAEEGRTKAAALLVDRGADINLQDKKKRNPIHIAAEKISGSIYDDKEIIEMLVEKGANIDAKYRNESGRTFLHWAARKNCKKLAEFLIKQNADVDAKDRYYEATPLHWVEKGEVAELLIEAGANINAKDSDERTPLHFASAFGREEVAKMLVKQGADIDARDDKGITRLHLACYMVCNQKVVEFLIEQGADINAIDNEGKTILHFAMRGEHEEVMKMLKEKGLDINAQDKNGRTPLHMAVAYEWWRGKGMIKLLIDLGAEINIEDKDGSTPLHSAVRKGSAGAVQFLVDHKAKINAKDKEGRTPLDIARKNNNTELLNILSSATQAKQNEAVELPIIHDYELAAFFLESLKEKRSTEEMISGIAKNHNSLRGVECTRGLMSYYNSSVPTDILNIMNYLLDRHSEHPFKKVNSEVLSRLFTFDTNIQKALFKHKNMIPEYKLFYAAKNGDLEGVEKAMVSGIDFNVKEEGGKTPLHWAAKNGHINIVRYLIRKGFNVNAKDDKGRSPLHFAAMEDREEIVNLLKSKHADVNMKDNEGNTPLHLTCSFFGREYVSTVKFLIDGGGDINKENDAGEIPLHIAARNEHMKVAEMFITKDKVNLTDKRGKTPLWYAVEEAWSGGEELVKLLIDNGADAQVQDDKGRTLLCIALQRKNTFVAKILAEAGVSFSATDVNEVNSYGHTLLHIAVKEGYKEFAEMLLEKGADVNAKDNEDKTPLWYAVEKICIGEELVKLLVDNGANAEVQNNKGRTPLELAVIYDSHSLRNAKFLIEQTVEKNFNPLHPNDLKPPEFLKDKGFEKHLQYWKKCEEKLLTKQMQRHEADKPPEPNSNLSTTNVVKQQRENSINNS